MGPSALTRRRRRRKMRRMRKRRVRLQPDVDAAGFIKVICFGTRIIKRRACKGLMCQ